MGQSFPELDAVGSRLEPEIAEKLGRKVANMLGQPKVAYPGGAPVSFSSRHLAELQREDYYVSEKTDGIRGLMYFDTSGNHYLIDRKNIYRFVPGLHFPQSHDETFQSVHFDTIIDGELVLETYEDGSQQLKYLVLDTLVLDGQNVMDETRDKRLAAFRKEILEPYENMCWKFPQAAESRPFIIEEQLFLPSYNIEKVLREIIPPLKRIRGNDGLVFYCRTTPYYIGLDEHSLKWKPASENTVDFRMNLQFPVSDDCTRRDDNVIPIFHLSIMLSPKNYRLFDQMYVTMKEWDSLRAMHIPLDNTIVECYKDHQSRWRFYRLRNDKADANPLDVVEKTLQSIEDSITEEDLIHAIPAIKTTWVARRATMEQHHLGDHKQ